MTNLRSLLAEYLATLQGKPYDQWGNARDHAEECLTPFVEWIESRTVEPSASATDKEAFDRAVADSLRNR